MIDIGYRYGCVMVRWAGSVVARVARVAAAFVGSVPRVLSPTPSTIKTP